MSDAHHLSDLPADEDAADNGLEQASTADAAQPDVDIGAPFVSLFSPNIPSPAPPPPSDSTVASSSSSRGHAGGSPPSSSRPLASLASIPAMKKRTPRMKVSAKQLPIAQFKTPMIPLRPSTATAESILERAHIRLLGPCSRPTYPTRRRPHTSRPRARCIYEVG
jgi:hypothetical protein